MQISWIKIGFWIVLIIVVVYLANLFLIGYTTIKVVQKGESGQGGKTKYVIDESGQMYICETGKINLQLIVGHSYLVNVDNRDGNKVITEVREI